MPGIGAVPKPTAQRILEGNPGKRPIRGDEPQPRHLNFVTPPSHMTDRGKQVWLRLADEMARIGLLTCVDVDEFERYCELRAAWEQARDDIQERGMVVTHVNKRDAEKCGTLNPSFRAFRDLGPEIGKLADRFGLTPSARTRIRVDQPESGDLDEFEV